MEDGNVFFYAALVLIAFISWVVGRIREAVDSYRERQRLESRRRQGLSEAPSQPARSVEPERRPNPAANALRETYRALGIPFPEDQEEQKPPPQRPPAQSKARSTKQTPPALSKEERTALSRLQERKTAKGRHKISDPNQATNRDAPALRRLLGNRSAIRQAILLKEILDPPKGLRSEGG